MIRALEKWLTGVEEVPQSRARLPVSFFSRDNWDDIVGPAGNVVVKRATVFENLIASTCDDKMWKKIVNGAQGHRAKKGGSAERKEAAPAPDPVESSEDEEDSMFSKVKKPDAAPETPVNRPVPTSSTPEDDGDDTAAGAVLGA